MPEFPYALQERLCNCVFSRISNLSCCLQLSIDIGTEVKYQNKMIDEMVSLVFILQDNNA